MLIAQGLGTPILYIIPIFLVVVVVIAAVLYFLIRWLGASGNNFKCWLFSVIFAFWLFYHSAFPAFVSSDALTNAAKTGAPSSRLIETVGSPPSTHEIANTEMMWYYETGYFASRTFGVTIERKTGKVVDWHVQ